MRALPRVGEPVRWWLASRARPRRAMGSSAPARAAGGRRDPGENPAVGRLRELFTGDAADGWEKSWEFGVTPWDLGKPTPAIEHLVRSGTLPKGRALVPGCGMGYDVVALASPERFVVGLDISDLAVKKAKQVTHSLWRRGPHAPGPGPAPIQSRSARRALRRQERERPTLFRVLRRKERKRRRIDRAAATATAKPALAPPPPASSRETLAEAAGASAPSTANPPPPTTPPGPIAQREAVPSSVEFTNRDSAGDYDEGSDSDGDKAEEREAAVYFTGLFERDAWLRAHYTDRWRKGRFQCMVCAAGGGKKVGKAVRRFRGCLALVHHARDASRGRSLCGRYGRRGAHRALATVVCRMLGWDIEKLALPRIVIDPRATAGVQHAKENDGAGENNGFSTDDDSYSIDEDEESEDEESVDEEEDIETGMPDPATDGDEEDSEIESNEEYAEKEDHENRMEDSSTDGDEDGNELERSKEAGQKEDADTGAGGSKTTDGDTEAIELDNSEKIPEKETANSVARKRDMKIRDRLLRLTHAKPVDTTPKKTKVRKRSRVPKHKEVSIPGIKFNEGSDKAKRKASALSYQGLKSSTSSVVKKVKVNQQPSNKGKQSKTNETGASARKAKRPAVAARKAKQLANKHKVGASTPKNTHRS